MSRVYEYVTDRLIHIIESSGKLPWKRPWTNRGKARNWWSQIPYRGINILMTDPGGEYATKKQIEDNGGRIKPEELKNYTMVVFWLWPNNKKADSEDGDKNTEEISGNRKRAVPLYSKVWEVNSQCTGLISRQEDDQLFDHNPIEKAESFICEYLQQPGSPWFRNVSGEADYLINKDLIRVPPKEDFFEIEQYYSVAYHEMVHSTGHSKRLNRPGIVQFDKFGSQRYSKEELVAEIGAFILCFDAGIDCNTEEQSAAYVKSWLSTLKNDKKMLVNAAQQAQKAVDFITKYSFEKQDGKTA